MRCTICQKEYCSHAAKYITDGISWACLECGKTGAGSHPVSHADKQQPAPEPQETGRVKVARIICDCMGWRPWDLQPHMTQDMFITIADKCISALRKEPENDVNYSKVFSSINIKKNEPEKPTSKYTHPDLPDTLRAGIKESLKRIPVIDDPQISEALRDMEEPEKPAGDKWLVENPKRYEFSPYSTCAFSEGAKAQLKSDADRVVCAIRDYRNGTLKFHQMMDELISMKREAADLGKE